MRAKRLLNLAVGGVASALMSVNSLAVPIEITGQLIGDIRGANPDLLIVDVTITSDTESDVANWVVDINSPAHPDIKLDEFYFNMDGVAADYNFDNFSPADWTVSSPATPVGAGGVSFLFESTGTTNVTNSVNLTFDMTLTTGMFTEDLFLSAPTALSNDAGQGQLGAHLQSLTVNDDTCPDGGCSDSGFAFGIYIETPDDPNDDVPVPGTVALLGLGLAGLGWSRRRKLKA